MTIFDIICLLVIVLQGIFSFCVGYSVGISKHFTPTQQTWLELEKFRWLHPMNSGEADVPHTDDETQED